MKSKFTWIFTLFLAFLIQFSYAQEKTISGMVTSNVDKMPMPGVNVIVQGTNRGVQTDFDGKFSIKASVGEKLVFSFLGSKTQTVPVGASNTINVQLEDDALKLEDVAVEGYNITRTKTKSNVASTTISAKTIEARPNASVIQTLQGQIAGVNISTGSGQPGSQSNVVIRGYGSLNGKYEPLYVIDGVPLNSDAFRSINPNEIESVSALVDAGATAIYGNRGANGVIVVKTKRGGFDSAMSVKYTSTAGFSSLQDDDYNMMNARQLLTLEKQKRAGGLGDDRLTLDTSDGQMTDEEIAAYSINTDWNDYFFRTGVTNSHDLSITSGSKNLSSFTSIGYFKQDGILKNSDLQRFSFRNNINGKSNNGKFYYTSSVSMNYSESNTVNSSGGDVVRNPVIGASMSVPYLDPEDYGGSEHLLDLYSNYSTLVYTPYFLIDNQYTTVNKSENIKIIDNFTAGYKFTDNLSLNTSAGIDYGQGTSFSFVDPESFIQLYTKKIYADAGITRDVGTQSENFGRDVAVNLNTNLNYNKRFGKNTFDGSLFLEYLSSTTKSFAYSKSGMDPKLATPGTGAGYIGDTDQNDYNVPGVSSSKAKLALFSYFGVFDYDYDGRFGLNATVRRDASSRFTDSNKWGTFYSISGRWNIDKEKFMDGSAFKMLKLRGSYGTTGNQDITNNTYGALNATRELYTSAGGYGASNAYVVRQLANPDLKWETTTQGNIGIDFGVLDNRLTGKLDLYRKITSDLYQDVPISAVNATPSINANYGSLSNKGIEATLAYNLIKNYNGFNFTIKGNWTYNKNELIDLPTADGTRKGDLTIQSEGHWQDEWYLVRYIGVNPVNGNLLFLDKNGNATETPASDGSDRVYTGKTSDPRYYGGFGFDADYKGFYLTTQFNYSVGIYRQDYDLAAAQDINNIGQFNLSQDMLRAWTTDNRVTDIPSIFATNTTLDAQSDRYLVDASYLRLRYIKFGYDVPSNFLKKLPFKKINTYVQAENLTTWSKWRGRDAENDFATNQSQYPTPKIVSVGFQLEF